MYSLPETAMVGTHQVHMLEENLCILRLFCRQVHVKGLHGEAFRVAEPAVVVAEGVHQRLFHRAPVDGRQEVAPAVLLVNPVHGLFQLKIYNTGPRDFNLMRYFPSNHRLLAGFVLRDMRYDT